MKQLYSSLFIAFLLAAVLLWCGCGSSDQNSSATVAASPEATPSEVQPTPPESNTGEGVGNFAGKEIPAFNSALADKGKVLYESKCAACHRLTSEKVVGPGLMGVTDRRKPQWILNMITNPEQMTKSDPTAQSLLAEHLTQMTNQNVSDEEALSLLDFLRQNDGTK